MGNGTWSAAAYDAVTRGKIASGTSFAYDRKVKSTGNYKVHELLDVKKPNTAGQFVREARVSDEHPAITPIIVGFDSTGSMGSVPRTVQTKLKTLFGLLNDKNYAAGPQVAVATYGDAQTDRMPIQFGQFETDNRVDDALDAMVLEGNGGGNGGESANLLLYYAATHTEIDAEHGYLFIIADEVMIDLTPAMVEKYIGDKQPRTELDNANLAQEVTKKWKVNVLLINNHAALIQGSEKFYKDLFGERSVTMVENPDTIAEMIAAIVGFGEGRDADTVVADVEEASGKEVAKRVKKALTAGGNRAVALR